MVSSPGWGVPTFAVQKVGLRRAQSRQPLRKILAAWGSWIFILDIVPAGEVENPPSAALVRESDGRTRPVPVPKTLCLDPSGPTIRCQDLHPLHADLSLVFVWLGTPDPLKWLD